MPKTTPLAANDAYLELIKRVPLRRLKNESDHRQAVQVLSEVSLANQNAREAGILDYLDVLADLIDQYEQAARLKMDTSHSTPAGVIRHLINAHGLTVSALAAETGIGQSNLSEMLSGRRDFSKSAISKLCSRFGLSSEIFF
jgi:antitoxin component HigA of HigAB toxin-antitoxin module